ELEQRQVELFGIRLSEDQMKKEIEEASSFWLSPESIRKIITLVAPHLTVVGLEFVIKMKNLRTFCNL
ncbi:MAG: hypothetical protein HQK63_16740, partial [Desulfamplus sp.]|nr:hypothetical protein [Desulfamplus sp.]